MIRPALRPHRPSTNHHSPQQPHPLTAATLATLLPSSLAGWNCALIEGGPGKDRLSEAVAAYEDAFGGGTHVLEDYGQYRALTCNGIAFGTDNCRGLRGRTHRGAARRGADAGRAGWRRAGVRVERE